MGLVSKEDVLLRRLGSGRIFGLVNCADKVTYILITLKRL